jgi:hypothetical protein
MVGHGAFPFYPKVALNVGGRQVGCYAVCESYQAGVIHMVTKQATDAQTPARRYAELIRDDPGGT